MKASRRQELKTNELSVYIQQVRDYLHDHGTKVLLIAVLVVALAVVLIYRTQTRARALANGWNAYLNASRVVPDPSNPAWIDEAIANWEGVIQTYRDPRLHGQSMWALANFCLQQSVAESETAVKERLLEKAQTYCDRLQREYSSNVILYGSALSALASIEENRFLLDGNTQRQQTASAYLERILKEEIFLGSPFRTDARTRLNDFDGMWTVTALVEAEPLEEGPAIPPPGSEAGDAPPDEQAVEDSASRDAVPDAEQPDADADGSEVPAEEPATEAPQPEAAPAENTSPEE